jgi:peptide/nickel transport system substrate-binding protein
MLWADICATAAGISRDISRDSGVALTDRTIRLKILATATVLPLLLCGCAVRWRELFLGAIPAQPRQALAKVHSNIKGLDQAVFKCPDPGPYKLIVQGSPSSPEELWQARGELGKFGGTFSCSSFGTGPKTFNYWDHQDVESAGIGMLMYETLIGIDPWTGKVYPRLGSSIEVGNGGKEYVVTLRKGLKWSDGQPLTADDVIFTYNTIVKGGFGNTSLRDTMTVEGEFPKVEKLDDSRIRFSLSKTFAPFLTRLGVPIAPKHIVEPITKKGLDAFHSFWDVNCDPRTIVGSGPFIMDRYVPGQRVEFVRNPHYGMVDKQGQRLPYLERFVYTIVPDQNTMLLKFYGNEIDILDVRQVRGSDAALIKQKEPTGNFKLYNLGPDDGQLFLTFNMARRKDPKTGQFYVKQPMQDWFNNEKFRQAMTHAIDRKRILSNVLRGVGAELFTCESNASIFLNRTLKGYPQDLDLAAKLLEEGGFKKKGDNLYDAKGNRVEFTLNTNSGNATRDAVCVMIQNDLKKLGIKVNYAPIDFNILIDKTANSLDWQAIVMGLTGSRLEPYDGANVWKVDGRLHIFDQRLADKKGNTVVTDARPWEVEIGKELEAGATTLDMDKRRLHYGRYQRIVYDENPYIYVYSTLFLTAVKNWIGNYMPTPLGIDSTPRGSLHNLEEIYIKGPKR